MSEVACNLPGSRAGTTNKVGSLACTPSWPKGMRDGVLSEEIASLVMGEDPALPGARQQGEDLVLLMPTGDLDETDRTVSGAWQRRSRRQ